MPAKFKSVIYFSLAYSEHSRIDEQRIKFFIFRSKSARVLISFDFDFSFLQIFFNWGKFSSCSIEVFWQTLSITAFCEEVIGLKPLAIESISRRVRALRASLTHKRNKKNFIFIFCGLLCTEFAGPSSSTCLVI